MPPLQLDYEVYCPRPWWQRLPWWWKIPFLVAVASFATFFLSTFRTMDYGTNPRCVVGGLLVVFLTTVPVMLPAVLISGRRMLVCWLGIVMLAVLLAEGWAGAQERTFARKVGSLPPGTSASECRWWPFQDHAIGYDAKYDTFYGSD